MVALRNLPVVKSDDVARNTGVGQVHVNLLQPQLLLPHGAVSYRVEADPWRVDASTWSAQWPTVVACSASQEAGLSHSGFQAVNSEEKPIAENALVKMGLISPVAPSWPEEVVRFPPGLDPLPDTPSHGSLLHGRGICKPCAWFWKSGGCKNGQFCSHCHLCSEGELKARKKAKVTMMRLGLVTPKAGTFPTSPPGFFGLEPRRSSKSSSESDTTVGGCSEHDVAMAPSSEDDTPFAKAASMPVGGDDSLSSPAIGLSAGLQRLRQPSEGSAWHGAGACQPCAWFWKPSSCQNGALCKYCHLCPEGEIKSRRKLKVAALRSGKDTPTPRASLEPKSGM